MIMKNDGDDNIHNNGNNNKEDNSNDYNYERVMMLRITTNNKK